VIPKFKELNITVDNSQERKTLLHMLYSLDFASPYYEGLNSVIKEWDDDGFYSIVVFPTKSIGANFKYYEGCKYPEYIFADDLSTIYKYLANCSTSVFDLGAYKALVQEDTVEVGCQSIPHAKVIEIYDAMVKIRG
jgi:hypothetical protein